MLKVESLSKYYQSKPALKNISFIVERGELVGLIGPNGAGKTTLFNCLSGLLKPTHGEVLFGDDYSSLKLDEIRKIIGYLPESTPLIQELTVKEYLKFRLSLKQSKETNKIDIHKSIELCDLKEMENQLIAKLSKGYKQRVGIAECLLGNPQIILMDEPINGLDPYQIIKIRELLNELKQNMTVIVSSHILSELELICDRYMIMSHGVLKAYGSMSDILSLSKEKIYVDLQLLNCSKEAKEQIVQVQNIEVISYEEEGNLIRLNLSIRENPTEVITQLNQIVQEDRASILELKQVNANLEKVYMELVHE